MPRKHSNSEVNRAGDFISVVGGENRRLLVSDEAEWGRRFDECFDIVVDWRNIHGFPLKVVSEILARRALKIDPTAIVAHRLKRFQSIRAKLKKSSVNNLTTMQDIAGCRAVLASIPQAYALQTVYERKATASVASHELVDKWNKDYIQNPKTDGYRSLHLVFKFRTMSQKRDHCNGLRVEVQIRSKMQHAWAMAVETASAVTNQALKSGGGQDDWKRFFVLVGDIIAATEGGLLICGMDLNSLRREAAELARSLKVIPILESMQHVIEHFTSFGSSDRSATTDDLYLLQLDSKERKIQYSGFSNEDFRKAAEKYRSMERENGENLDVHIVLVSVGSLKQLKTAYPSYFLDSSGFIQVMRQQIYTHENT
jgi:hypothetical protein